MLQLYHATSNKLLYWSNVSLFTFFQCLINLNVDHQMEWMDAILSFQPFMRFTTWRQRCRTCFQFRGSRLLFLKTKWVRRGQKSKKSIQHVISICQRDFLVVWRWNQFYAEIRGPKNEEINLLSSSTAFLLSTSMKNSSVVQL